MKLLVRRVRVLTLSLAAIVALLLIGVRPGHSQNPQTKLVQIVGNGSAASPFAYLPPQITIPAGTAIVWQNTTLVPHTATSDSGAFDTGAILPNAEAGVIFPVPGTYPYHCSFHPYMRGVILVTGAGPTETATAPSLPTIAPPPPPAAVPTATPTPTPMPTATTTATPTPTSNPTATATPPLTLRVQISLVSHGTGQRLRTAVTSLPGAVLTFRLSFRGVKSVARQARTDARGAYVLLTSVPKRALHRMLTVDVTAQLGSQTAQVVVQSSVT